MILWLWVALGGALGACARFAVAQLVPVNLHSTSFPWLTLTVNVLGSFLIGLLVGALSTSVWFNDFGRAFLVTGVLGGFTTFSAFSLEVVQLAQAGQAGLAAGYVVASLLICLLGAAAGLWLGANLAV
jgi:CrcB protein